MMLTAGALATALAVAIAPADAAQRTRHLGAQAAAGAKDKATDKARAPAPAPAIAKAPTGLVFGGITQANWPIVVTLNKARTRVDQAVIGLDMQCSSGDGFGTSDGFKALKISPKGRFSAAYGPERIDAGGTPADLESRVVGRFKNGRASMRGVWSLKVTLYDPAGTTVVDTCESGLVNWIAEQ
jgi:hypothetical protein